MGAAGDRVRQLAEHIGTGELLGTVEVNQIYAHYQHEHPEFRHPRGGQAFYLQEPLYAGAEGYVQRVADDLLDLDKSIADALFDGMKDLVTQVETTAPVFWGNLRESGHATVTDKGAVVHDEPPKQARLSESELRALSKARGGHKYGR